MFVNKVHIKILIYYVSGLVLKK